MFWHVLGKGFSDTTFLYLRIFLCWYPCSGPYRLRPSCPPRAKLPNESFGGYYLADTIHSSTTVV